MAVMPRESWTDERLDDFRGEVNRRFDDVDRRLDETNRRMEAGFAEMRQELQRGNDRLDARLDALHHLIHRGMIAFGVGIFGVIVAFIIQH